MLETEVSSWARMAQLSDGSWLAAYTIFETPTIIRVKRSFDWQKQTTSRDEIERDWKQGTGRLVYLYRRLRRRNLVDPYRLYNGIKRRGWSCLQRLLKSR